jgi:hypothetical protein
LVPFAPASMTRSTPRWPRTIAAIGSFLPSDPSPKRRYPYQPTSGYPEQPDGGLVAVSPRIASLELDEGVVQLTLLTDGRQ